MKFSVRGKAVVALAVGVLLLTQGLTTVSAGAQTAVDKQVAALYAAAKKEGRLNIQTTTPDSQTLPLINAFKKRFPGIRVTYLRLSTIDNQNRFNAEASAKVNSIDVFSNPDRNFYEDNLGSTLVPLNKANLPGGFPGTYPKKFVFSNNQLAGVTVSPIGISWNTRMMKKADVPTSFEALLDPQYKGKIISTNPSTGGVAFWEFWDMIESKYGPSFLTKFKENRPIWYSAVTPAAQSQAAGEAPLQFPSFASLVYTLAAAKAPLDMLFPEVTTGSITYVTPALKASHPAAARLFTWFHLQPATLDAYAQIPGQVSPNGGGMAKLPKEFVFGDTRAAAKDSRRAELAKLLGLKY